MAAIDEDPYLSGVYELNKEENFGYKVFGDSLLPTVIPFVSLANLMVKAQKKCFKDKNRGGSNKKRIMRVLQSTRTDKYDSPTIAVSISIHLDIDLYDGNDKYTVEQLFSYNDIGLLTIQLANIHLMSDGAIPDSDRDGYWIHEVCKDTQDPTKVGLNSPTPNIMRLAEQYIKENGGTQSYLLVEKKDPPKSTNILLRIYGEGYESKSKNMIIGKYKYQIVAEDDSYYYMKKELNRLSGGKRRTKRRRKKRSMKRQSRKYRKQRKQYSRKK